MPHSTLKVETYYVQNVEAKAFSCLEYNKTHYKQTMWMMGIIDT